MVVLGIVSLLHQARWLTHCSLITPEKFSPYCSATHDPLHGNATTCRDDRVSSFHERKQYTLCTTEHWINVASFEYFIILINHCSVYFKIILKNQKYLKIKSWTINIYFKILLYILLFQSNSIPWCWKFFSKENSKWDILKSEYRKYFLVQDCSFEDLDPRD